MAIDESHPCKRCGNSIEVWKDGSCAPCRRERAKARYKAKRQDPEAWAKIQAYGVENRKRKKLYEESPQKYAESRRKGSKKRRQALENATPSWLTPHHKADIEALYFKARYLTNITKETYVVDHIEPLQGKNICGLHVPWNLRVVTYEENAEKSASKCHKSEWEHDTNFGVGDFLGTRQDSRLA